MTLTTRFAIIRPTPVRPVFDECRRLLGAESARYGHDEPSRIPTGRPHATYHTIRGQGLPAALMVRYGVDGPILPADDIMCERRDDESWPSPTGWAIEVAFDTAIGYQADNGAGCSDLHAWLVRELGAWCSDRGLTWNWCEEHTGQWHPSSTTVDRLGDPEKGRLVA